MIYRAPLRVNTIMPLQHPFHAANSAMPSFPGGPGLAHAGTPPGSPSVARDQCKGGGEFWGDVFGHALGDEDARGVDKAGYSIALLAAPTAI